VVYKCSFLEDDLKSNIIFRGELEKLKRSILDSNREFSSRILESSSAFHFTAKGTSKRRSSSFEEDFEIFRKIARIADPESYGLVCSIETDSEDYFEVWIMRNGLIKKVDDPFFSSYSQMVMNNK